MKEVGRVDAILSLSELASIYLRKISRYKPSLVMVMSRRAGMHLLSLVNFIMTLLTLRLHMKRH